MKLSKLHQVMTIISSYNCLFFSLRRISKLPPMTQLKVNFCNKLLGGKSTIIHRLGDVVNCKEVYEKYGNERKYKVKPKKKRRRPRPVRPDVSLFVVGIN